MTLVTLPQLAAIIRQDGEAEAKAMTRARQWIDPLTAAMTRFGITTPARIAAFLAQISLESAGLTRIVENLNYSAQGLAATWPHRYAVGGRNGPRPYQPNALALRLHRNPEAIANNCYADRMGNGPEARGNGWRYRGRGPKQITGHDNYAACGKGIGLDLLNNPDLLLQPSHGAAAAGWFWSSNGLSALADKGDFAGITRAINGGLIGHDDNDRSDKDTRVDYWLVAKRVMGVA